MSNNKFTAWPLSKAATREPAPTGDGAVVINEVQTLIFNLRETARHLGNKQRVKLLQGVYDDLNARAEFGRAKYGTYLRANNGRDALNDLQQENYDAIMYSGQLRMQGDVEGSKWLETYIEIAVHLQALREQRETKAA